MIHGEEGRWAKLVRAFPCLRGKPGVDPWDAELLDEWATKASSGERLCAAFVLNVWNGYATWKVGEFDLVKAGGVLDNDNLAAIASWVQHPWFP
jgi:hypothetical protein